jgi:SPP1 gp7 family putative phage head morphogenesis protein
VPRLRLLALASHDAHQERLLARADRVADAAEAAVRSIWLTLLEVMQRGKDRGPAYWHSTFNAVRDALSRLPLVAHGVTRELVATARDSAQWTAETTARSLPVGHRAEILRRHLSPRPAAGDRHAERLEEEYTETDLVAGLILPAWEDHQILSVVYAAGWVDRLRSLTALSAPDVLAARIASGVQQGLTIQQIALEIRPVVQQVQTSARRVARTAGLWVAHEAELATYGELGDMIDGYRINAVLDHATRPEHRKRDGQVYHCRPVGSQLGLDRMPRPPREADGSWAFNCRCYLSPILSGT